MPRGEPLAKAGPTWQGSSKHPRIPRAWAAENEGCFNFKQHGALLEKPEVFCVSPRLSREERGSVALCYVSSGDRS